MKKNWLPISTLAIALAAPVGMAGARAYAAPAPAGFHQERGWDQPPDEYRDVQRQGFHDGIEAARRDYEHHRHKDADDHQRYKHPPVNRDMVHDYRDGFQRGYEVGMRHFRDEHHDHDDHPDR